MTIKEFYLDKYSSDDLGKEIDENSTWVGLLHTLHNKDSVYDFLGVHDSVIRERVFEELARQLRIDYNHIYELWLYNENLSKEYNDIIDSLDN